MMIIKRLSEMIGEEISDADKYVSCAMKHKDGNPQLAETFYRLSMEEMQHMSLLHDQVVRIIEEYRRANGDPPPGMMAIYDYLHEQHIKHSGEVKAKQMLYKGQ